MVIIQAALGNEQLYELYANLVLVDHLSGQPQRCQV